MRLFLATTTLTIALGLGAAVSPAEDLSTGTTGSIESLSGPSLASVGDVRAPEGGEYVRLDRAFQRLELEAQLEDFYADLQAQAEGLSEDERIALYREAEEKLRQLILQSDSYAGQHRTKGLDYFSLARYALAHHLGLDEIPT